MSKGMSVDFGFDPRKATPRAADAPMRLLLIGDFSGASTNPRPPLATRPTHRLDLDLLDGVIAKLAPRVQTALGAIAIASVDDFHPDRLFARLELFRALRNARTQPPPASLLAPAAAAGSADESPLTSLLGGKPAGMVGAAALPTTTGSIEELLRRVVAPHVVPDRLVETRHYVAAVDSAIAQQMRELLHDPAFMALEAAWRGVQWLVSSLELDEPEQLQLHLLDVSRDELLADVAAAGGKVQDSGLYRAIVTRTRQEQGKSWSAIAGLWHFGGSDADIGLLAAMGILAAQAGGPFLAQADATELLADGAAIANWNALRTSGIAPWIGLVSPRVLLRRPYGARDEPAGSFTFEEILSNDPVLDARQYLWGPGALAAALLLGQGFRAAGGDWSQFSPDAHRQIGDLPTATRLDRHGDQELLPSAERFIADTEAEAMLDAGLMPLLSHRHLPAVQLMRFQSIAHPTAALGGLPA